jgi:chloramphenicol 3-O-phosphotransferase
MTKEVDIIIVNGAYCCGKTTMTREMQALSERPFVVTGIDDFVPMFSAKYIGVDQAAQNERHQWSAPGNRKSWEGFEILIKPGDGGAGEVPTLSSRCGPIGWSLLTGMHQAFAAMARAGNSLIGGDAASDVLMYDYCATLKGLKVYLIGVYCSLEELERRGGIPEGPWCRRRQDAGRQGARPGPIRFYGRLRNMFDDRVRPARHRFRGEQSASRVR